MKIPFCISCKNQFQNKSQIEYIDGYGNCFCKSCINKNQNDEPISSKQKIDPDRVRKLIQEMPVRFIAKRFGCSPQKIENILKKHNIINPRTKKDEQKIPAFRFSV